MTPSPAPSVSPPVGEQPGRRDLSWLLLGLLMFLVFISHLNRASLAVAADKEIMSVYGISTTRMGMVYSSFLFVYTGFMLAGGYFIDRFGPRLALLVVGFGSGAFCVLTGLSGMTGANTATLWLSLMVVRGLMGLVSTPLHPGCARAIGAWTPPAKWSLFNGFVTAAAGIGVACTFPLFGKLVEAVHWQRAFLVTGAITLLWAAVWHLATRRAPADRLVSERAGGGWGRLLRNRGLLWLTASYAAIGYFQYLFFYWMHYYFQDVLKLGKAQSDWYAAIPPLAMAFSMPLGGWLTGRAERALGRDRGRALVPKIGMAAAALFLFLGLQVEGAGPVVTCFSLALGAVGLAEASFWSMAVQIGGRLGGTSAAIVNTGGNAGGMLVPVVTPMVSKALHWEAGLALAAFVCMLGALCWFGVKQEHRNEQD